MERRVVVTGIGVVAPTGIGRESFWQALMAGKSCCRTITLCDPAPFRSKIAAEVPDWRPAECGLSPEETVRMDRYIQFAVVAAREAVADARLGVGSLDRRRLGVCMGTAIGASLRLEQEYMQVSHGGERFVVDPQHASPYLYHAVVPSSLAAEVAALWGARGPVATVSTGCTAGMDAVAHGFEWIQDGEAAVVVAGASEAGICPITIACFDSIKATSCRNAEPERASRPFDRDRDGFVLGEGCAVLVLEELQHALGRGVPIYAEIVGFGGSLNAFHMTGLEAHGLDMAQAIEAALQACPGGKAGIGYINAHGSSTRQNDLHETNAFKAVWGARAYQIPVSSIKSMVGHSLGAIGAIEVAACALALQRQMLPPTINYAEPDPDCDLDYVPNQARPAEIELLVSTASGFGGFQSAMVLKRWGGKVGDV